MFRLSMAILVVALAAGCSGSQSAGGGAGGAGRDSGDELGIWNGQGTELLASPIALEGFWVDTAMGWALRGKPLGPASVERGELVVGGQRGTQLVGVTFTATGPDDRPVKMRISGVRPHRNQVNAPARRQQLLEYVIEYRDGRGPWRKLCADGNPGALALPGSFARGNRSRGTRAISNGDYDASPARLTFGCEAGVVAKCIDWGYPPWDFDMPQYFQACTRMARADYCGNGHSRTVEGTVINYGDLHEPPLVPFVPIDGFAPEAVWGVGGGKGAAAICLSRTRWSTIPIGRRSPCADLMPDPREMAEIMNGATPARFCDDMTVADWAKTPGALFVNNSRMADVGLFVWTDGAGRYITTSQYPWYGKTVTVPSPPGYPTFVSVEGSSYKPTVRRPNLPGLIGLYRYTAKDGRSLTTTQPPPREFGDGVLEAWVYAPERGAPTSTATQLYLHADGRGNHATTTDPTPPPGYQQVTRLGWLPH